MNSKRRFLLVLALLSTIFLLCNNFISLSLVFIVKKQIYESFDLNMHDKHLFRCFDSMVKLRDLFKTIGSTYPPKYPESLEIFSQNSLPIKYFWYIDDNFIELKESKNQTSHITKPQIDFYSTLILNKSVNYNPYNDIYLEEIVKVNLNNRMKKAAIIGLHSEKYHPWLEAMLLMNGISDITVVDLNKKTYDLSLNIEWIHLADFFQLNHSTISNKFDVIVNHLSVEQLGLGRFGESVSPNADLDMIHSMNCLLKNDGILFLTLSKSKLSGSYVEYNVRRVYGEDRLNSIIKLSNVWNLLQKKTFNFGSDQTLVLKKTV